MILPTRPKAQQSVLGRLGERCARSTLLALGQKDFAALARRLDEQGRRLEALNEHHLDTATGASDFYRFSDDVTKILNAICDEERYLQSRMGRWLIYDLEQRRVLARRMDDAIRRGTKSLSRAHDRACERWASQFLRTLGEVSSAAEPYGMRQQRLHELGQHLGRCYLLPPEHKAHLAQCLDAALCTQP